MSQHITTTELRKMTPQDLSKEIGEKRGSIAKMRIAVAMRTQKDTAQYRREKKDLARMLTVLQEINHEKTSKEAPLKTPRKASKVPTSAKPLASTSI